MVRQAKCWCPECGASWMGIVGNGSAGNTERLCSECSKWKSDTEKTEKEKILSELQKSPTEERLARLEKWMVEDGFANGGVSKDWGYRNRGDVYGTKCDGENYV